MENNETVACIMARSSIRAYTSEQLTTEELNTLSDVALASPTAMDLKEQKFFFITNKALIEIIDALVKEELAVGGNKEILERIASRGGKTIYGAPLLVLVCADTGDRYSRVNAGIAVQSLALAAKSMGLDSCILGLPEVAFMGKSRELLKEKLGIPESMDYVIGIAIGHAATDKAPHEFNNTQVVFVDDGN